MTQVKYNDQKWLVLLNGSWVEIAEKDWEKIFRILYKKNRNLIGKEYWLPTPDQIYSLQDEVEFEINELCICGRTYRDTCPDTLQECRYLPGNTKQVAHLKESEPKKEETQEELWNEWWDTLWKNPKETITKFKLVRI